MKKRVYNASHYFVGEILFEEPSQEEILNCPEFFAMSYAQIRASGECPPFLDKILGAFPWTGRNNVIQVKPQDFRKAKPSTLGEGVHLDLNVRLKDGKIRTADNLDDFHLSIVSFGGVCQTEFVKTPMELPDLDGPVDYLKFFQDLPENMKYHSPKPGQLATYRSSDLHRMSPKFKLGNARLMIVAFECNKDLANGIVLPSIIERPNSKIKFEDYHT